MEILAHDHDPTRGRKHQRGAGRFTLCAKCNNDTGSWYGTAYVEWAIRGLRNLHRGTKAPSLYLPYRRIYPLRILKQLVCLFFSANGPDFRERHPYLVRFVLNKYLTGIPPEIQIYCYLQRGPTSRLTGIMGAVTFGGGPIRS